MKKKVLKYENKYVRLLLYFPLNEVLSIYGIRNNSEKIQIDIFLYFKTSIFTF